MSKFFFMNSGISKFYRISLNGSVKSYRWSYFGKRLLEHKGKLLKNILLGVCFLIKFYDLGENNINFPIQGDSHWGEQGAMVPHFNFWTKQSPTFWVSKIRDIACYGCSEIIRTRNFTIFTVYAAIFGQLTVLFHFF